jgi:hypothetical protein
MKTKKTIVSAAFLLLMAGTTQAGTVQTVHVWEDPTDWMGGHFCYNVQGPRYTAQELSFDMFGSFTAAERGLSHLFETNIRHGEWGGGVGLNYFFIRELGIGADINIPANGGNFVDSVSASLIARWPIEPSGFAPYIFGGGGRGTDPAWEWLAHAGVGVEYRWNPTTGIFVDGRYMWADQSFDRLILRGGVRLVF